MKKSKVSALLISLLVVSSASSTAFAAELEQKAVQSENVMPTLQTPITQSDSSAKTGPVKIGDSTEKPATENGQNSQTDQGTTKPEVAPVQAQPNDKDEAVTDAPVIEKPATEVPATEEPKVEKPSTEAPATEEPKAEQPVTEVPSVETPATEVPATTAPAVEVPVVTAPAVEVPVVTAPAVEVPVVTAPAIEVPVMTTLTIKHVLYLKDSKIEGEEVINDLSIGTKYDFSSNVLKEDSIVCITTPGTILIEKENMTMTIEYKTISAQKEQLPEQNSNGNED